MFPFISNYKGKKREKNTAIWKWLLNRENLNRHRIELYIKREEEIYIVQIRRIEKRHLSNRIIQRSGRH